MSAHRDKYSGYAEVVFDEDFKAWCQNDNLWRLCQDNQVMAEAHFHTTRERRDDWSGKCAYKVITTHHVAFTVRGRFGDEPFTTNEYTLYGGEVAAVREILRMLANGHLFEMARSDMYNAQKQAGVDDYQRICADDIYDARYDSLTDFERAQKRFAQNLSLLRRMQSK